MNSLNEPIEQVYRFFVWISGIGMGIGIGNGILLAYDAALLAI
jgi:hypothetical protein